MDVVLIASILVVALAAFGIIVLVFAAYLCGGGSNSRRITAIKKPTVIKAPDVVVQIASDETAENFHSQMKGTSINDRAVSTDDTSCQNYFSVPSIPSGSKSQPTTTRSPHLAATIQPLSLPTSNATTITSSPKSIPSDWFSRSDTTGPTFSDIIRQGNNKSPIHKS